MPSSRPEAATAATSSLAAVDRYSGFRPEVQGLRAVAVLLVVLYHVFMGRVSGGVDIFLAISAFFMTLSFVRKLEGGRPLDLGRYWLHVFKRLLPLAVITILGTYVLLVLFYPATSVPGFRTQGMASALYLENWALALESVDYYAADHSVASPFQHFWSLSVQGQVFLLWPLIFAFAWWVRRRTGRSSVPVLAVCFGLVFVVSLTFSVITTHSNQAFAYFDTRTRLWEFAVGSLVALAIPYLKPPRWLRVLLGWAGIVSMVSVGVLVDVQGAFPGWIALWPLLSAAAIIVAGQSGSRFGFDRFLSWSPIVKMGDAAYALYLVHWPFLITYLVIRQRPEAGFFSGTLLVLVSVLVALVATEMIERPLKSWTWPERTRARLGVVVVVCIALAVGPALVWSGLEAKRSEELAQKADVNNPGALATLPGFTFTGDPDAPTLPLAEELPANTAVPGDSCPEDVQLDEKYREFCHVSVENPEPSTTVLVPGNSHIEHWLPALKDIAEANDWRVLTYIKPGCHYTETQDQRPEENCGAWWEGTEPMLEAADPDIVVVQGSFTNTEGDFWRPTLESRVRTLTDRGIQVVGIRDVPRFTSAPGECAVRHGKDAPQCDFDHPMLGTPDPQRPLADELPGFSAVDMTDVVCPGGVCRPVVGNVFVYFDDNHLSRVYSETAGPVLGQRIADALTQDGVTDVKAP